MTSLPQPVTEQSVILTPRDLESQTWATLRKHLLDRKVQAMVALSSPQCPDDKTLFLRARIAELNALLGLDPSVEQLEVTYHSR